MPGWDSWKAIFKEGFKQARKEGREETVIAELELKADSVVNDDAKAAELFEKLLEIPIRTDLSFEEPSDLEQIKALRVGSTPRFQTNWSDDELLDKLNGAWLGRCVGCALGKPVEGFMSAHHGLQSWQRQKEYLLAISLDEWPLKDYFPQSSPAQENTGELWCPASTRENITFMESDDDIRYTVLGQKILLEHGRNFTSWDVACAWIRNLSYSQVCTAETQAYRNLVWRYGFHLHASNTVDVDWNWVATFQNPYREWIGAQIRVDSYAYAAPGDPGMAAEFAWRDARISHVKNGIYGAMFCSAMIAAAFATKDVHAIVEAGLGQIPATSRLYLELRQTMDICKKHSNDFPQFEAVITDIYAILGHYSPVHTNNNAAICLAAILLSQGDFHKGVTFAVMGGWDTDCNGATVGSILGAMNGARNLPSHWTRRLNDTLNSEVTGYHPIEISKCARRAFDIARQVSN